MRSANIQDDSMVSFVEQFEDEEYLKQDHVQLLKEIAGQFSIDDDTADLGILFECTGFKGSNRN